MDSDFIFGIEHRKVQGLDRLLLDRWVAELLGTAEERGVPG